MLKNVSNRTWSIIGIAIAFLLIGLLWTTSSAKAITMDDAKNLAANEIPKSAVYVDGEERENKFVLMYYDQKNGEKYIVEISKKTQKVKKIESQRDDNDGSKTITLKEVDIEKIIKENFPGVKGVIIKLDKDNGLYEYDVAFKGDKFYGEADVNPETGIIMESTIKMGTAVTIPQQSKETGATPSDKQLITKKQAKEAAVKASNGGTFTDIEIEKENGKYYYEVEVMKKNGELEYIIDAKTGKIMAETESDIYFDNAAKVTPEKPKQEECISVEQVKEIVLVRVPGARIADLELDWEKGRHIYEVKAFLGDYEYEFEIDSASGVILKLEKEAIEDDNDADRDDD